ncbi:hypothetical protein EDD85DRAFT_769932, partial [Armillaria nabsnona]
QSWIEKVHHWIYQGGNMVDGKAVSDVLNRESLSPTWNTFSSALISLFNFYQMFIIDPLHEIELGTWKALFIHLLQLCQYYGGDVVQELNKRQVSLTTASQVIIFKKNVSDMKNFAARDYEDILQCAMPCFEGLFL